MSGTLLAADNPDMAPFGTIGNAAADGGETEDLFADQTPLDSGFPFSNDQPIDTAKRSETHMKTGAFILFAVRLLN